MIKQDIGLIKKLMGILKEDELKDANFSSGFLRNDKYFKKKFLEISKKVFDKTGNWGNANNPNIDCYTNDGIINIYTFTDYSKIYNVPESNWSIINFFNTNVIVLDELIKKFNKISVEKTLDNFLLFIEDFFETKINTKEFEDLVIINLKTLSAGVKNEVETFKKIKDELNLDGSLNFCPGSKIDTKKGVDFTLSKNNKNATFQVKSFYYINKYAEYTNIITKEFPSHGYSKKIVDYIIFKNKDDYYIMENDIFKIKEVKTKIGTKLHSLTFKSLPLDSEEIIFK